MKRNTHTTTPPSQKAATLKKKRFTMYPDGLRAGSPQLSGQGTWGLGNSPLPPGYKNKEEAQAQTERFFLLP